ncbi:hypothetical protein FYK55_12315 [Roseiconus nitratireducens]|uniref:Uncharacterized protein n=1 Tax=Roseiconus nitratireducens TaxID=2605748 RepID=A0A5M6D6B6_9BACT|nr:hypothetical protein [Roseiconus nitratireducens]KAA5543068.1 hypothetical protein FYK55_12315 [Roseiconus nitratireducens]
MHKIDPARVVKEISCRKLHRFPHWSEFCFNARFSKSRTGTWRNFAEPAQMPAVSRVAPTGIGASVVDVAELVQVRQAIEETNEAKLIYDDLAGVTNLARETYLKARTLHRPWPQLAAYRLAHLLMRSEDRTHEILLEAEKLFAEASDASTQTQLLGAMPLIYRMAALHLLDGPDAQEKIADLFDLAIRVLDRQGTLQERETLRNLPHAAVTPLQRSNFNLLELASYLLNLPYAKISGLGTPLLDPFEWEGSWTLRSNTIELPERRCSLAFAEAEIEGLLEKYPGAVGFRLSRERAEWWNRDNHSWENGNGDQLLILAKLLEKFRSDDFAAIQRELVPGGRSNNQFDQTKQRLKKQLARITGVDRQEIFGRGSWALPMHVFGIVSNDCPRNLEC